MTVDVMWRKNRRTHLPNSTTGGSPHGSCVGVDLNRNYNFLWDFSTYFNPSSPVSDSNYPCDYQVYHGPAAFSEPESKNAKWIFDNFPNIRFFVDLHSYSEDILYSWGDDDDQTNDPSMNFKNPAFNGLRGITNDSAYMEYIPSSDLTLAIDLANNFRDGIQSVRGTTYIVKPSMGLYPTAGSSDDYAYSRHFIDSSKEKVIAYTLEWGKEFQPPYTEMYNIIQDITSGLITFCIWVCNNSLNLRLSKLENMVESLQSQITQLHKTRSIGIRRKISSKRAKTAGSSKIKTKWKSVKKKAKKK